MFHHETETCFDSNLQCFPTHFIVALDKFTCKWNMKEHTLYFDVLSARSTSKVVKKAIKP